MAGCRLLSGCIPERTTTEDDKVQRVPDLADHQHVKSSSWVLLVEFLGPGNRYLNAPQVALMISQLWESLAHRVELRVRGTMKWW